MWMLARLHSCVWQQGRVKRFAIMGVYRTKVCSDMLIPSLTSKLYYLELHGWIAMFLSLEGSSLVSTFSTLQISSMVCCTIFRACVSADSSCKLHYTELQAPDTVQRTLALFCENRRMIRGVLCCPHQKGFTPDSSTHIPYHTPHKL